MESEELSSLQQETDALLDALHGGRYESRRRQRRRQRAVHPRTRVPTRRESPPGASGPQTSPDTRQPSRAGFPVPKEAEAPYRTLDFGAESARLSEGIDSFFPQDGVAVGALRSQTAHLRRTQARQRRDQAARESALLERARARQEEQMDDASIAARRGPDAAGRVGSPWRHRQLRREVEPGSAPTPGQSPLTAPDTYPLEHGPEWRGSGSGGASPPSMDPFGDSLRVEDLDVSSRRPRRVGEPRASRASARSASSAGGSPQHSPTTRGLSQAGGASDAELASLGAAGSARPVGALRAPSRSSRREAEALASVEQGALPAPAIPARMRGAHTTGRSKTSRRRTRGGRGGRRLPPLQSNRSEPALRAAGPGRRGRGAAASRPDGSAAETGEGDDGAGSEGGNTEGADFGYLQEAGWDDDMGVDSAPGGRASLPARGGRRRRRQRRHTRPDAGGEEEGEGEEQKQRSQEEEEQGTRLFLPDGAPAVTLRDTVEDALRRAKFESVSSLLSAGPPPSKKGRINDSRHGERKGGEVEAPSTRGGEAPASRRQRKRQGTRKKGEEEATALRHVTHAGFDLSPRAAKELVGADASREQQQEQQQQQQQQQQQHGDKGQPPSVRSQSEAGSEAVAPAVPESPSERKAVVAFRDELEEEARQKEVAPESCFACWSAGKPCRMHTTPGETQIVRGGDSVMVCDNWDISVLTRRYRAEEIEERFAQKRSSLRWDGVRGQFVTKAEPRHSMYRLLMRNLVRFNARYSLRQRIVAWLRSFIDLIRRGAIKGTAEQSEALRARHSAVDYRRVHSYTAQTARPHKPPPYDRSTVYEEDPELPGSGLTVVLTPLSEPLVLYAARPYSPLPPRHVALPKPPSALCRLGASSEGEGGDSPAGAVAGSERAVGGVRRGALSAEVARLAVGEEGALESAKQLHQRAFRHLRALQPDQMRTQKRAAFLQLVVGADNCVMGGLPTVVVGSQRVTTYVPAQFGMLLAVERDMLVAPATEDHRGAFVVYEAPLPTPPLSCGPIEHAINSMYPPTVIASPEIPAGALHYFGENRPEQTGFTFHWGFRTSWSSGEGKLEVWSEVHTSTFSPSAEVALANTPAVRPSQTSHADLHYPFCVPTTRPNTVTDFYHLLITSRSSPNDPCVFTSLSQQEPGRFGEGGDCACPLGSLPLVVYRSFAYTQTGEIEARHSEEGVPFWYNRRTGETYWEKPLMYSEEETASLVGAELDAESESKPKGPAAAYSLSRMRAYMLSRHLRRVQQMKEEDYRRARARQQGFMGASPLPESPPESPPPPRVRTAPRPPTGSVPWTARTEAAEGGGDGAHEEAPGGRGGGSEAAATPAHAPAVGAEPGLNPAAVEALMRGGNVDASVLGSLGHALSSLLPHLGGEGATPASGSASPTATPAQAGTGAGGGQSTLTPAALINLGLGLGLGLGVRSTGRAPPTSSTAGQGAFGAAVEAPAGGEAAYESEYEGEDVEGATDTVTRRLDLGGGDSTREEGGGGGGREPSQMPDEARGLALARRVEAEEGAEDDGASSRSGARSRPYDTHPPASQRSRPGSRGQFDASDASAFAPARPSLPADFLSSLYKPRTVSGKTDFTAQDLNVAKAQPVGVTKPGEAIDEWLEENYDPWSAGRPRITVDFISDLDAEAEDRRMVENALAKLDEDKGAGGEVAAGAEAGGAVPADSAAVRAAAVFADHENLAKEDAKAATEAREAIQLRNIFSLSRHGKYREVEEMLNSPDWTLGVDAKDAQGNTLLMVAAQNNNKRIAKLALRRGAQINEQNLAGQTALHYCFAYGFEQLGNYLISKGADDSVLNAEGLTCYEGLAAEDLW